jgi:hypothetical protein
MRSQSWPDLRRRLLEESHPRTSELQRRRRRSRQMKHAIWLLPLVLVLLAPPILAGGVSLSLAVAALLISYGATASFLLGSRWERRWDDLIREKSARDHD